jgi:inosine-uridine nucleoside N-ribohydrolase
MALQMLFNYKKEGKIDLKGITICKDNPYTVPFLDGYCRFNGCNDMPLGYARNGVTPDDGTYLRQTLDTLIDGKPVLAPARTLTDSIPEACLLMRKLLAAEADSSVVIIAVGPETNLARLLNTEPDQYSNLNGRELVQRKVYKLVVMGGRFSSELDPPEWNIISDIPAAQITFAQWPTPLIASGWEIGDRLHYPHQSILNDLEGGQRHPLCMAYCCYHPMPYDRETWDLTAVLHAIEPDASHFSLSPAGNIRIDSVGKSLFTPDVNGSHRYLCLEEGNIEAALATLVKRVTGKK